MNKDIKRQPYLTLLGRILSYGLLIALFIILLFRWLGEFALCVIIGFVILELSILTYRLIKGSNTSTNPLMDQLREWKSKYQVFTICILGMLIWSIFVLFLACCMDLFQPPEGLPHFFNYQSYWKKLNWALYPAFFLLIIPAVYYSWFPFLDAWKEENSSSSVIKTKSGENVSPEIRKELLEGMDNYRLWLMILALVGSSVFLYFDTKSLRIAYLGDSYNKQLKSVIDDPDFFSKWLFDFEEKSKANSGQAKYFAELKILKTTIFEKQETRKIERLPPTFFQILFFILCYAQEFFIFSLGFFCLFQLLAQICFFGWFEYLKVSRKNNLTIWLDYQSSFGDFGLSKWNHALDRMYWTFAIALIIPWISRESQTEPGKSDVGQMMGEGLLYLLVFLPLALSVFTRQSWVNKCVERVSLKDDQAKESFKKQYLWPFEFKIQDKLGLVLCLFMFGLITGKNALEFLLKLFGH